MIASQSPSPGTEVVFGDEIHVRLGGLVQVEVPDLDDPKILAAHLASGVRLVMELRPGTPVEAVRNGLAHLTSYFTDHSEPGTS